MFLHNQTAMPNMFLISTKTKKTQKQPTASLKCFMVGVRPSQCKSEPTEHKCAVTVHALVLRLCFPVCFSLTLVTPSSLFSLSGYAQLQPVTHQGTRHLRPCTCSFSFASSSCMVHVSIPAMFPLFVFLYVLPLVLPVFSPCFWTVYHSSFCLEVGLDLVLCNYCRHAQLPSMCSFVTLMIRFLC